MVVISEKETFKYLRFSEPCCGPGIPTELRAGRSRDRLPVGVRFSAPVQTGPGAHPTSCTMCTGSFPEVKSGRGVTLTPHPLLVPWSRKSSAIHLLLLWALRHVQSLSACTRVHFTFRFHGRITEDLSLLGCYFVKTGKQFRLYCVDCLILKIKAKDASKHT